MIFRYVFKGSVSGTSFSEAATNIKSIHAALSRQKDENGKLPKFAIALVHDNENKYDKNAVKIYVQTQLYGRLFVGHISARGYCPMCDAEKAGHGHTTYGEKALLSCPQCSEMLTTPDNKLIAELLGQDDITIKATAFFVGGTAGKENLGIRYDIEISKTYDGVNEVEPHISQAVEQKTTQPDTKY